VAVPTTPFDGAEAFTPTPDPLCVTPTIWSVVEPLKFVGPSLAAPFLIPSVVVAGSFAGDDDACPAVEPLAVELAPLASTKSEILFPPKVSASCALKA